MKVFYGEPRARPCPGGDPGYGLGQDYFGELKIVDVNIRRLRLKIEDNCTNPTSHHHGVGIRIQVGIMLDIQGGGRSRSAPNGNAGWLVFRRRWIMGSVLPRYCHFAAHCCRAGTSRSW